MRFIIISPEFFSILASATLCLVFGDYSRMIISYFTWDAPNFIIAFFGVPVALVVAAYKFGTDLLSKNRRILLDSGLYRKCKNRVIFSCILTSVSFVGTVVGYVLVRINDPDITIFAATILSSGWVCSMISVATLAIADFTIKEIEESN